MTLQCQCGVTCRIPSIPTVRLRCGKCQRTFTPMELAKAKPEPPPVRHPLPTGGLDPFAEREPFELEQEDDINLDDEGDYS